MTADPPGATGPLRVLIADDHAVVRAGLRALLDGEPDLDVIAEAGSGEEAVSWSPGCFPMSR